ncbi:MAG: deoxyribodipyrimidine photo-lyase [Parachlamydiales bacterium]|nr:deoxyribodipyrimidine photo-lyase [Parachlamydiales bacterium]
MVLKKKIIVWFRQDLRLNDQEALWTAFQDDAIIIPLFIWSPKDEKKWPIGNASRQWLKQSLELFSDSIKSKGSRLIIRQGAVLDTILEMVDEVKADGVFWGRCYEPYNIDLSTKLKTALKKKNLIAESFNTRLLFEPWEIATKQGNPFQVFTPFWRTCQKMSENIKKPFPEPETLNSVPSSISSESISIIQLKEKNHWKFTTQRPWEPGEKGAVKALEHFSKDGINQYSEERDRPDHQGTSRISPHLHFGEISPRTIWHHLTHISKRTSNTQKKDEIEAYLRQVIWREFAYHLLYHFPHTVEQPLRAAFNEFGWEQEKNLLKAWKEAKTGFPIVDAGIKELLHSGWMHNRVRLIAASFLIKDLLIHWIEGARFFWENLVDADLANNTMGWQWVAGCGADAAPYFRIFNPVTQSQKFDPDGVYITSWLPELKKLPAKWIHSPWLAPLEVLKQADIELGSDYPYPIVDHDEARKKALSLFEEMREKTKD